MLLPVVCPHCDNRLEFDAHRCVPGMDLACPSCHRLFPAPDHELRPGVTLGGFRILRLLGKGAMGEVYLAQQLSMDREVALKILPPQFTRQEGLVERFLNEVRAAARLDHPHIVTAYEAGEDTGIYYLAMAYVRGETLAEVLARDGALDETRALRITRKIAAALKSAWDKHQLLHRDIKPGNIMLDEDGEPRLLDLGLVKFLGGDRPLTMTNLVVGTPNYMSPEQAEGRHDADQRADIYGLGATLYHMLTGQMPFAGSSVTEVLRKQVSEPLEDPRVFNPGISEHAVDLLELMLAKDPAHRYQGWDELIADVDRVLAGEAVVRATPLPGESVLVRADDLDSGEHRKRVVLRHSEARKLRAAGLDRRAAPPKTPIGKRPLGGPPAARRKRAPIIAAAAAGALLLAAGGVGLWVLASPHQPSTPAPAPAPAVPPAEEPKLEQRLEQAIQYNETHPEEYERSLARFRAVAKAAQGTELAPVVASRIREVEAAQRVAAVMAASRARENEPRPSPPPPTPPTEPTEPAEPPPPVQPPQVVENPAPPPPTETGPGEKVASGTGQDGATPSGDGEEKPPVPAPPKPAGLSPAERSIADALLAGDLESAHGLAAGSDAPGMKDLAPRLDALAKMPDRIMASFKGDLRKEVPVVLNRGRVVFQIDAVQGRQVRASKLVRVGGQVVGSSQHTIAYDDLALPERYRRLGAEETPERNAMRALILWQAGEHERARALLGAADDALGRLLQARLAERAGELEAQRRAAREMAAARAYRQLLQVAGVPPSVAGAADVSARLVKHRPTRALILRLRDDLARFEEHFGGTDLVRTNAPVLLILRRLAPVQVDPNAFARALKRLQADNPDRELFVKQELEDDGIVLDLTGNMALRDLSALAGLPLKRLVLKQAAVTDVDPLKDTPLRSLVLEETPVEDLSPLAGLLLEDLEIRETKVHDISALKGMPLRRLVLAGSPISDLSPLAGMPLSSLEIYNISKADLRPLKGVRLTRLTVSKSGLQSLEGIEGAPLEGLNITENRVADLDPIADTKSLKVLILWSNPVADLYPIRKLRLQEISVGVCRRLRSLQPLHDMPLHKIVRGWNCGVPWSEFDALKKAVKEKYDIDMEIK